MPETMDTIAEVVEMRLAGTALTQDEIQARVGKGRTKFGAVKGNVAVLPLYGVLAQHAGIMVDVSGGTSTDAFAREFDDAMASAEIGAVVIDVDSPGGSVYGLDELSERIYNARGKKPIVAVANSLAASGGYYVASAADEFAVTPGGEVGSVGVVAIHTDVSEADAAAGVKRTIIKQGKYKADGNPYEPLSDEAQGDLQKSVDEYYDMFVGAVARNRGKTALQIRQGYGEGRVVGAKEALDRGMVDRISTLEKVIDRLAGEPKPKRKGLRAEAVRRTLDIAGCRGNGRTG
jgi:signal peptide peptidase SppA